MRITIITTTELTFNLEIGEDLEFEDFKALCQVESGIGIEDIIIVLNGRPLFGDKKTLKEHGLADGDLVMLHKSPTNSSSSHQHPSTIRSTANQSNSQIPNFDFSSIQVPNSSESNSTSSSFEAAVSSAISRTEDDPKFIRDQLLKNPEQLALLKQNNPPLAEALLSGDFGRFSGMIREMQKIHREREKKRLRLLTSDSMDIEAQKLIEQEIRQNQVDANMEAAMEFSPESFGTVCMLYINCKVNGVPVKAFIDSGAQTTIMSTDCAERCKIMRLVDTRFSGIAKGVGTQKILGRIHMVQVQIGSDFFHSSFSILEDQKMDMLLGLDMLKRHQCVIDLQRNVLKIGTTGTETNFLPESELPDIARLTSNTNTDGLEDGGLSEAIERSLNESSKGKQASSSNNQGTPSVDEKAVSELMNMGFPRDKVIFELERSNGDKNQAIAALLAKSLTF